MALPDEKVLDLDATATGAMECEVYVFPTSFAQRRLWFLSHLEPDVRAYHIAGAFNLRGRLREEALARSFDELVRRHEILRTTFSVQDGEPVQMAATEQRFELRVTDLYHLPAAERGATADRLLAEELRRPFDLLRGPLLRAGLVKLDEEEQVLYYVFHHIVSDGGSEEILVRELATLYQAFAAGRPSPLLELPIQMATSRSGSGIGCRARRSRSSSPGGSGGSPGLRPRWSFPPTGRGPRRSLTKGPRRDSRSPWSW